MSHMPDRKKKKRSEKRGKSVDRRKKKDKPKSGNALNNKDLNSSNGNHGKGDKPDGRKTSMRSSQTEQVLKISRKNGRKKEEAIDFDRKRKRKSFTKIPSDVVFKRKKDHKTSSRVHTTPGITSNNEISKPPPRTSIRNGKKNNTKIVPKSKHQNLTPRSSNTKINFKSNAGGNATSNRKKTHESKNANKSDPKDPTKNPFKAASRRNIKTNPNLKPKDSHKLKTENRKNRKSKLSLREIPKPKIKDKAKDHQRRSSKRHLPIPKTKKQSTKSKPNSKRNSPSTKIEDSEDSLFEGFSIESVHRGRQEEAANLLRVGDLLQYSGEGYSPTAALDMSEKQLNWEKMTFLELLKSDDLYFERRDGHTEELIRAMEAASPRGKDTISKFFSEYMPKTHRVQREQSRFAKQILRSELSKALQKKRENDFLKRQMVESFGVIDFSDDGAFKSHFYEFRVEYGPDQAKLNKIRPAQSFLPEKQYEIYLLDLSVINRYTTQHLIIQSTIFLINPIFK